MFYEQHQIVPLLAPIDVASGSSDTDSMNMGKFTGVELLIMLGALTGDAGTLRFYGGATAGAKTTEIFPYYQLGGAAAGTTASDVLGARTVVPSGGIVLTSAASWTGKVIKVEVPAESMPDGMPWLTIAKAVGSASVALVAIVAVGIARYEGTTHTTSV